MSNELLPLSEMANQFRNKCNMIDTCCCCEMIHHNDLRQVCIRYKQGGETTYPEKFSDPKYIPTDNDKNTLRDLYLITVKSTPPKGEGNYENEEDYFRYYIPKLLKISELLKNSTPEDFAFENLERTNILTNEDITNVYNNILHGDKKIVLKSLQKLNPPERNALLNGEKNIISSYAIKALSKILTEIGAFPFTMDINF